MSGFITKALSALAYFGRTLNPFSSVARPAPYDLSHNDNLTLSQVEALLNQRWQAGEKITDLIVSRRAMARMAAETSREAPVLPCLNTLDTPLGHVRFHVANEVRA